MRDRASLHGGAGSLPRVHMTFGFGSSLRRIEALE
jgi:hypothetical protein